MYRIEISPSADRDLAKLAKRGRPADMERVANAIDDLADNPRPDGVRKIKGTDKAFRIRAGDYRVVYDVLDSESLVVILLVSRRSETTYR
ncbi:MAG: type II toxin-antitoxin system RelE/ParE family toxin [Chloroflexi bacterium]|nr:type II toxin-antitoxin system RelE/ParE family toxin [Chloroflexota bacterium]